MIVSRREWMAAALAGPALGAQRTIGLAIGTYGMKTLPWEQALKTIREIGYDGVELSLIAEWPTEASALTPADRKAMRSRLKEWKLALPSLLENLQITGAATKQTSNLERLRRAVELGHDVAPGRPPVIETVLGGKTADWERLKPYFVKELKEWARIAESGDTTVCFKPHAAHAVHSPDRALWLIREVGSPRVRVIYDFSHMDIEGFPLAGSMKELLPMSPFIHIKDAKGTPANHEYLLPGDGKTDYSEYFRLLKELGYAGFVAVEVSAMIHRRPGYQAVPTAKLCYERMSKAMAAAGIQRPKR